MNELSVIFVRLGISTDEGLKAAGTKWNCHLYLPRDLLVVIASLLTRIIS